MENPWINQKKIKNSIDDARLEAKAEPVKIIKVKKMIGLRP